MISTSLVCQNPIKYNVRIQLTLLKFRANYEAQLGSCEANKLPCKEACQLKTVQPVLTAGEYRRRTTPCNERDVSGRGRSRAFLSFKFHYVSVTVDIATGYGLDHRPSTLSSGVHTVSYPRE
jgi:hypothetical protein